MSYRIRFVSWVAEICFYRFEQRPAGLTMRKGTLEKVVL